MSKKQIDDIIRFIRETEEPDSISGEMLATVLEYLSSFSPQLDSSGRLPADVMPDSPGYAVRGSVDISGIGDDCWSAAHGGIWRVTHSRLGPDICVGVLAVFSSRESYRVHQVLLTSVPLTASGALDLDMPAAQANAAPTHIVWRSGSGNSGESFGAWTELTDGVRAGDDGRLPESVMPQSYTALKNAAVRVAGVAGSMRLRDFDQNRDARCTGLYLLDDRPGSDAAGQPAGLGYVGLSADGSVFQLAVGAVDYSDDSDADLMHSPDPGVRVFFRVFSQDAERLPDWSGYDLDLPLRHSVSIARLDRDLTDVRDGARSDIGLLRSEKLTAAPVAFSGFVGPADVPEPGLSQTMADPAGVVWSADLGTFIAVGADGRYERMWKGSGTVPPMPEFLVCGNGVPVVTGGGTVPRADRIFQILDTDGADGPVARNWRVEELDGERRLVEAFADGRQTMEILAGIGKGRLLVFCDMFNAAVGSYGYARIGDDGGFDCELNKLKLTYEEAVLCLSAYHRGTSQGEVLSKVPVRTNIPFRTQWSADLTRFAQGNTVLEVANIPVAAHPSALFASFSGCTALREVYGLQILSAGSLNMFSGCRSLRRLEIHSLRGDLDIHDSPLLSAASLRYVISNAANTVPVTIILHPEVFTHVMAPDDGWEDIRDLAISKDITLAVV